MSATGPTDPVLQALLHQIAMLENKLSSLEAISQTTTINSTFKEPKVPTPDKFNGNKKDIKNFIASIKNLIQLQPSRFPNEETKILYTSTLLSGDALTWFRTQQTLPTTLENFWTQLNHIFGDPCAEWTARDALRKLNQGKMSCVAYTTKFHHLSLETGYDTNALYQMYHDGLNDQIKDALSQAVDVPLDLEKYVNLCIKIDNRQFSRRMEKATHGPGNYSQPRQPYRPTTSVMMPANTATPMQLDAVFPVPGPLSQEEKQRRMTLGLCLYCGTSGHLAKSCPKKSRLNAKVQGQ
jgi:Ty3 transposon capsid-like protein